MKKRVKIDVSILLFAIILTGLFYRYSSLYTNGPLLDDFLNFFGLLVILKGTFLRMSSRGYKKAYSGKGHELVKSGPYAIIRNPMYLGSFLIGAGFILIVWPFWMLPVFVLVFYSRFNKQMVKEEKYLIKEFGITYENYCMKIPRIFPKLQGLRKIQFTKAFPFSTLFITKEKWGLLTWPLLALFLEIFQEKIVFGQVDIGKIIYIFILSAASFILSVGFFYLYAKDSK